MKCAKYVSLLLCTLLFACAAHKKEEQLVFFDSHPRGAKVYVDDHEVGRTPISVFVPLNAAVTQKKIYQNKQQQMIDIDNISNDIGVEYDKSHKVIMFLEGKRPVNFIIQSKWFSSEDGTKGPNYVACIWDSILSIVTFGLPIMADAKKNACGAFNASYSMNIDSGESNKATVTNRIIMQPQTSITSSPANSGLILE